MKLNIKTTNIELTPAIEEYLEKRVTAVVGKLVHDADEEALLQAEVGKTTQHHKSGDVFRAELNMRYKGEYYRAVSEKDDLYAAIDDVRDDLMRAVKSKTKRQRDLMRRGATAVKNVLRGLYRRKE